MNFRCIWAQDLVVVKHLRCPFKHVCGNYVVTYGVRIGGNINSINAAILRQSEHFIPLQSVGSRRPDGYSATLCSDISPDGGWRGDFVQVIVLAFQLPSPSIIDGNGLLWTTFDKEYPHGQTVQASNNKIPIYYLPLLRIFERAAHPSTIDMNS